MNANFLIHYDPAKPLLLACDALPYGLGAVLSHQMPGSSEKPITFASRTLKKQSVIIPKLRKML